MEKVPGVGILGIPLTDSQARCIMCNKIGNKEDFIAVIIDKDTKHYYCPSCRDKYNETIEAQKKNVNYLKGFFYGLAGAILGGALWIGICLVTGMQIGYLGLGLGLLIGYGVHLGSGKKKGILLQIIGGIIATISIFFIHYLIVNQLVNADIQANLSEYPGAPADTYVWIPFFEKEFLKTFLESRAGLIAYALAIYLSIFFCKRDKKI